MGMAQSIVVVQAVQLAQASYKGKGFNTANIPLCKQYQSGDLHLWGVPVWWCTNSFGQSAQLWWR
eukprot:1144124-Pelagomonas_calceolata.AAC.3